MEDARQLFNTLNHDYLAIHKAKEDLFWDTYMAVSDDHDGFSRAEEAYKNFISDPVRLAAVRSALSRTEGEGSEELRHGLKGWLALFESNIIDSDAARKLMSELIGLESALFAKKRDVVLTHLNEKGEREEATLGTLSTNMSTNMSTNRSEAARKSSFDVLAGMEQWVLENGFLDIVQTRNAFARAQGYNDYFAYKVHKNEQMSVEELFTILDDFEVRTRDANQRGLNALAAEHGKDALLPWNFRYTISGDVARQLDPYLPFAKSLERWVESFCNLGVSYRGATLQLDLLERKGKYQNGFCHGPVPSFMDAGGRWVAGQINFTADAKPDQVGSGARATTTLFHEGGHAAHFANITQNAPCFSQEFAPSSTAYAETQSMFCDSLLDDADWLKRYAKNAAGEAVPDALIKSRIEKTQPFAALNERNILVVPYFERALYQLSDAELTAERVTALARQFEWQILGLEQAPRPLLAIPHLLNQESAASYHGYLLANMAVYQTRAFFEREYGYLTDNPAIGPLLSEHYWAPGNSISHNDSLVSLTGEAFNAKYLADACNQTIDEAWAVEAAKIAAAAARVYPESPVKDLDAHIRIVHGALLLADNQQSAAQMYQDFEQWITAHYPV